MAPPAATDAPQFAPTRTFTRLTVAALLVIAAACAALAALVPTDAWAAWFHHPSYTTLPTHTLGGAQLWRIMLALLAACLALLAAVSPWLFRQTTATTTTPSPSPPAAPPAPATSLSVWGLLALLILALLLRIARLGESLWYDEIALWLTYGNAGPGAIVGNYFDPVNHIAHSLVTWLSVQLGESTLGFPLALRLPALLFSLLAVVCTFGVARCAFPPRVALVAALLAAVLPVAVFEGVEARGYSMMIALTAASTWTLLVALRTRRPAAWLGYAALAALAVWAHLVTACVFAGHALWLTWRAWRERDGRAFLQATVALALAGVLTLTLYAPVLREVIGQLTGSFQHTGEGTPTLLGAEGVATLWQVGGAWTWWAALPGLALVGLGLAWMWQQRGEGGATARAQRDVLALLWLGWPVALLAVVLAGTWVYARFTLFVVPAAAVTMALGIELLWQWRPRKRWGIGVAALALVVVAGVSIGHVLSLPPKQPLREAAMHVRQQRSAHEAVASIGIGHHVMRMYALNMPLRFSPMHGYDLPRQLDTTWAGHAAPHWIIVLYPNHLHADAADALRAHGYERVRTFDGWNDWGDVHVYRAAAPRGG